MKGSCLCGAVTYMVQGRIGRAFYCHCSRCRKASGSAFATNVAVEAANFRFTSGEKVVRTFTAPSGLERLFCGECGSPLLSRRAANPDIVRLRVGTLDTPLPHPPEAHAFADSKPEWHDISDELPVNRGKLPDAFARDFPYEILA